MELFAMSADVATTSFLGNFTRRVRLEESFLPSKDLIYYYNLQKGDKR